MSSQRVFITGASTGLGAGLAEHYAKDGAILGLVARREKLLEELKEKLEAKGATVHIFTQDVADTAGMQKAIDDFIVAAGGIDLVIANAGVGIRSEVLEGNAADIAWLMGVNVIGVTNTVVPFVPQMLKQGSGVLCTVSSSAGHRAIPGRSAYSASKIAVRTFMDGLRMDLHDTGVHSMTLMPGFVDTPLTKDNPDMFFVIDIDKAVECMSGAINNRKKTFTFPWQMNLLKEVTLRAPESLLRKMSPKPRTKSMS
ncbi:MAG: SDR family NAD(P)-dependent oxidoreductase [Deltaproteobacteria bacterium]|nr:SDR family NAD(P)-dependent oxidoreductase [Deltaproteobacteria bacterium]